VGSPDPTDVFNDLSRLVAEQKGLTTGPRQAITESFARVPHDRALDLFKRGLSPTAWAILIELDRMLLKNRGRNPFLLWSPRLRAAGISSNLRRYGLRQLQRAGVISVRSRGHGLSPWVTHHWYELKD
jgi:hypothetical protein